MNIFLLLYGLLIMLLILWYMTGKDLFAPSVVVCLSYILSTICAVLNIEEWGGDLQVKTVVFILSGVGIIGVVNIIVFLGNNRLNIGLDHASKSHDLFVQRVYWLPIVLFQISAMVLYYREVKSISGAQSYFQMMSDYRMAVSYGTEIEISGWVTQLFKISKSIALICVYILINNLVCCEQKIKNNLVYFVPIVFFIFHTMLTGGRFEILVLFCAALSVWNILSNIYVGRPNRVDFKNVLKGVVVASLLVMFFFYGKSLVGRVSDLSLFGYLTKYIGGSIKLFDMYVQYPIGPSDVIGQETFYSLLKILKKLSLVDFHDYIIHLEFRYFDGATLGNVYTGLRRNIQDFGFIGMLVMQSIFSIVYCSFYEKIKSNPAPALVMMYSMIFFGVVLHSINDCFYTTIVSFNYVSIAVCTLVLYRLFTTVDIQW